MKEAVPKREILKDYLLTIASSYVVPEVVDNMSSEHVKLLIHLLEYNPDPKAIAFPVKHLCGIMDLPIDSGRRLEFDAIMANRHLLYPVLTDLQRIFSQYPAIFENQLFILLSIIDHTLLAKTDPYQDPEKRSTPTTTYDNMALAFYHENWYLCPAAERRMLLALAQGDVIIVNDKLVVKMVGKLTAYCLDSFSTSDGFQFQKGYWYSPTDVNSKEQLKVAFKSGERKITLPSSSWVAMRKAEQRIVKDQLDRAYLLEFMTEKERIKPILENNNLFSFFTKMFALLRGLYGLAFHDVVTRCCAEIPAANLSKQTIDEKDEKRFLTETF